MTSEPRDTISEITEIVELSFGQHVEAMFASVGWSTLLGATGMTVGNVLSMEVASGAGTGGLAALVFASLIFSAIATALFTALGILVIGLPLTFVLSRLRRESLTTYTVTGGLSGAAMLAVLMVDPGDFDAAKTFLFLALGAGCGAVCARRWGSFRTARSYPPKPDPTPPHNPFHDMLH